MNNYGISKCSADINGSILHLICKEWIFPFLVFGFIAVSVYTLLAESDTEPNGAMYKRMNFNSHPPRGE